jgi:glucose-6-phosphate 1-dehydrogenase
MPDRTQTIAYPAPGSRPSRRDLEPLAPHVIVLFGATGDLAKRKLLPGLAYLQQSRFAPDVRIIGSATEDLTSDEFRGRAREAIETFGTHHISDEDWATFAERLEYVPVGAGPEALAAAVKKAEELLGPDARRLHYLSVPPKAAQSVIAMLRDAGLVDRARVVME